MKTLASIVAATDFSVEGNNAVRRASQLAREQGAALRIVHVLKAAAAGWPLRRPFAPPDGALEADAARARAALRRIVGRGGEPLIRRGVDMAMRLMGEQFVTGETIAQALVNARTREAEGFRYSYDMLGEAAMTADDAQAYFVAYERAIDAIGRASAGPPASSDGCPSPGPSMRSTMRRSAPRDDISTTPTV